MERYLITQSLVSSWAYMFDCYEGIEDDAKEDFLRVLHRESRDKTQAMLNGIAFENEVYKEAAGMPRDLHPQWESGIMEIANIIQGTPVQIKVSRELGTCGMTFLVYGVLDALKSGTIYDVKFSSKSLSGFDAYGKYLHSAQHPFYFYLVPEAVEFKYLLSDGSDLYIESYRRDEVRSAASIINEFISSITEMGLLDIYKEKWVSR